MGETLNQTSPETERVSDIFVLHGYSLAKGIGVGKYIASDEFTVGGYKWAIHFYPDGKHSEDNLTYVSVYIALMSEGRDLQPLFEFTLMDQSGKGKHRVHTRFTRPHSNTPEPGSRTWGYGRFFWRAGLETSDYVLDDCLKIYYTVGVVVSDIDCSRLHTIEVSDSAREMAKMPDRIPMRSCSLTEMISGSNLFLLQGYSTAKGIGVGNYIASNEFTVGGFKWAIHFYPDGKTLGDTLTNGSMGIALKSEGRDVRGLFELTLMDQSGKGKHKLLSTFINSTTRTLRRGSVWGYKDFFRRPKLEISDYLQNDCWKIYCTVGIVSAIDYSRLLSVQVPDSNIGAHIGMLLENTESCDITFNVSGEKLHAHKLILAARSPKLRSELLEGMNTEEIMVPDMEPKVFKALLHFIYTDALAENELVASAALVADTLIAKLLAAADHYDLKRLKRLCESHLSKYINVNSVIKVLALADRYNAAELEDICLTFAAKNLNAVLRLDGFECHEGSSLKFKLLDSVGGCGEDCSNGGGKSETVSDQLSDGGDNSGRRVRQRVEKEKPASSS